MKGDKPDVPAFKGIDITEQMRLAISGNQANLPGATKLANETTAANLANITRMFQSIPGFDKLSKAITDDASAGPLISQELADYIQNSTAANALGRGVAGGGFQRNLFKTGLIREGIAETNRRLGAAERWISGMAAFYQPAAYNIGSMFVSPQFRIESETRDRDFKFQRDVYKSQIDAAPDPTLSAIGGALIKTDDQLMSMASSVLGAAAGACWVAREVFGNDNPQWIAFWAWKEFVGPRWFRAWYAHNGERFALWISDKPAVKARVKYWMLSKIS